MSQLPSALFSDSTESANRLLIGIGHLSGNTPIEPEERFLNDMLGLWRALSPRRRIIVAAATFGVFLGLLGLSRMAAAPDMALLYGGLDGHQAGEMIRALDASSVGYEVRGDSIFVDAAERDALRMQLAADGMLAGSGAGYEILDGLSGFGTTSQMFDAAYWRAKEGELARTILAAPGVRQVRVHIAQPPSGGFRRDTDVTASVTVTAVAGGLTGARADTFRHLVAAAVPGLAPDRVTVVDAVTGRLLGDARDGAAARPAAQSQEETLSKAVERLLAARFGPENAIVEVSVSPVTDAEIIRERRVDPQSRVAISTNVEEISTSERNGGGSAVTVASNLPDGDAADGEDGSQSQNAETRTVTNFEVSEVIREIERMPGSVKRLTVAVLVNRRAIGVEPEAIDAELDDVRALVAASVGFDEARGDSITVKALAFEPVPERGTAATRNAFADTLAENPMRLVQLIVLALVTIILAVFVIRPILASRRRSLSAEPADDVGGGTPGPIALVDTSEKISTGSAEPQMPKMSFPIQASAALAPAQGETVSALAGTEEDPVMRLKALIESRQPDTVEILRNWLEEETFREKA